MALPRQRMYWCNDFDIETPIFAKSVSRDRFEEIKKYLHFANNDELATNNRFSKMQPIFDITKNNLQQFGVFSQFLSIDEQMVSYRGRHPCKQFIRNKPVRFGYKMWMMSSSDGYPFAFQPYQGRQAERTEPLGSSVVRNMCDIISRLSDPQ